MLPLQLLSFWIGALAGLLRSDGSLTLLVHAYFCALIMTFLRDGLRIRTTAAVVKTRWAAMLSLLRLFQVLEKQGFGESAAQDGANFSVFASQMRSVHLETIRVTLLATMDRFTMTLASQAAPSGTPFLALLRPMTKTVSDPLAKSMCSRALLRRTDLPLLIAEALSLRPASVWGVRSLLLRTFLQHL